MLTMFFQQIINGLMIGSMYALVALGVTMTFGLMDIVNFAHGQFVMMGEFFCYLSITLLGMNFFIAFLVSIFLTFAVGIILERYTYRFARLNPINGLMISIGLIFVLENLVIILWGVETKTIVPAFPGVIKIFDLVLARQRMFAFLSSALFEISRKTLSGPFPLF